jgi:hypothetical protein
MLRRRRRRISERIGSLDRSCKELNNYSIKGVMGDGRSFL